MRNGYGMVQKIREAENEGSIEESKEGRRDYWIVQSPFDCAEESLRVRRLGGTGPGGTCNVK